MSPEDQQPRGQQPMDGLRPEILSAATAIALENGFAALTLDALAKRLGTSPAGLEVEVGDFDQLVGLAMTGAAERAFRQVSQTGMPPLSPQDAHDHMVESISMYLAVVRSNPEVWRLALMTPDGTPQAMRELIEQGRIAWHEQMVAAVAPILPESVDAELTAWALSALADNYARLVLIDPDHNAPSRLLEHARVMVAGVLSELQAAAETE